MEKNVELSRRDIGILKALVSNAKWEKGQLINSKTLKGHTFKALEFLSEFEDLVKAETKLEILDQ